MSRRERIVSARSDDLRGLSGRRAASCGLLNTHDLAVIRHADRVAGSLPSASTGSTGVSECSSAHTPAYLTGSGPEAPVPRRSNLDAHPDIFEAGPTKESRQQRSGKGTLIPYRN